MIIASSDKSGTKPLIDRLNQGIMGLALADNNHAYNNCNSFQHRKGINNDRRHPFLYFYCFVKSQKKDSRIAAFVGKAYV